MKTNPPVIYQMILEFIQSKNLKIVYLLILRVMLTTFHLDVSWAPVDQYDLHLDNSREVF